MSSSAPIHPDGALRIALAQINATVGDIAGNAQRIRDGLIGARAAGAELVLFPELALTGYPPEDLLLKEHFLRDARAALEDLATAADGIVAIVGVPERAEDVFNAAAVLADGRVAGFYRKWYLPNYGVFDEQRYFQSGAAGALIELGGHRIGLTVCEDMWEPGPPASDEAHAGAPFRRRGAERFLLSTFSRRLQNPARCRRRWQRRCRPGPRRLGFGSARPDERAANAGRGALPRAAWRAGSDFLRERWVALRCPQLRWCALRCERPGRSARWLAR